MSAKTNESDNTKLEVPGKKYIVGIGASAGGLEALQKFLSTLPPDTGFPYVIVQHLSPDYKSLLGEILGKYTEMPVIQVEDGMEIKPNNVYVIAPGKNMTLENGKLHLTAQKAKELNLPIDMFFRSLAADVGPLAIAIILSGTGSDGSNGIKDIKEHDGMIIVQTAESSKFDGMPRSALRTGLVDAQLSPEDIAFELRHISLSAERLVALPLTEEQIDEHLMKKVYSILKRVSDINFVHYKQTTIMRRIERRMMLVHKDNLSDYVDYLYEFPEEAKTLSKEVLIGVTNFFRDPEYFQCLQNKAINTIVEKSQQDEPIRVWIAGCSTGEEAYSIAILFKEAMEVKNISRTIKIFATDLDKEAIAIAAKGVYGDNIISSVTPARLSRYFSRKNNTYVINHDIRKMIVFSPHNVFQDPPFGRLDLISCRNMLIYFQPVLQNDLFGLFHQALKDGGFLFLGKSEAIGSYTDAFPIVDPIAKIFTHRSDVKIPGAKPVPFLTNTYLDDTLEDRDVRFVRYGHPTEKITVEQEALDTSMFEQFMPTSLVVNDKNDVVRIYGETDNFIHLPTGKITTNVFELLTDALKVPASTILKEARTKRGKVQYKNIAIHGERVDKIITMTAMPATKLSSVHEDFYALVFSELTPRGELIDATNYDINSVAAQRISDLEQELGIVQDKLSNSIADQECVSEELQSANEELLTANEELQSSNEELQSVNEELYTVNTEYQQKMSELAGLNDDIANFLSSTLTGIIFVDNKLNIKRYTDYISTEFAVLEQDINRPVEFIAYQFPEIEITEICEKVLKTLIPDEREVVTNKEKMFFMRVAPYRSTENKILGCVITFIDITTQKLGQVRLENVEKRLADVQKAEKSKRDYITDIARTIKLPVENLQSLIQDVKTQADSEGGKIDSELDKMTSSIKLMESIVADIEKASSSK